MEASNASPNFGASGTHYDIVNALKLIANQEISLSKWQKSMAFKNWDMELTESNLKKKLLKQRQPEKRLRAKSVLNLCTMTSLKI